MAYMNARYVGTCAVCGGRIDKGDWVQWYRGAGARHADCKPGTRGRAGGRCIDAPSGVIQRKSEKKGGARCTSTTVKG